MSRKKSFNRKNQKRNEWKKSEEIPDENNLVVQMFSQFSKELDDKHDRYERIIKINRDITIESKRIIYSLHNIHDNNDKESKLSEINLKFESILDTKFKLIAEELKDLDPYLYHRSFTASVQEFVEAFTYYVLLKDNKIPTWENLSAKFLFRNENDEIITLFFSQYDFLLGIADLTGELMRRCINCLGLGSVEECYLLCQNVRNIYSGFLGTHGGGNKEFRRKVYTLKQSLTKMELVCYNLQVRGQEVPKDFIANAIEESDMMPSDEDEGYY